MSSAVLDPAERRSLSTKPRGTDRVFLGAVRSAGVSTLLLMGLIGIFLAIGAWPALEQAGPKFLTESQWLPGTGAFGIASILWGTILVALIALLFAVPVGFAASLFITEYCPRTLRPALVTLVDLMAAIPSIVYGMWAFFFLQAHELTVSHWIAVHLGPVIPFLRVSDPQSQSTFTASAFIAGTAVGVVVMPTVTSIMREVFAQAPQGEREGAIALGATRWGMIRTVVIPFGVSGIVGGIMLGLGRALGETIAVYLIISPTFSFTTHPLESGTNTIAALIASRYSESSGVSLAALLAAGLVLFAFTLIVNTVAGLVIARSRSGSATEI